MIYHVMYHAERGDQLPSAQRGIGLLLACTIPDLVVFDEVERAKLYFTSMFVPLPKSLSLLCNICTACVTINLQLKPLFHYYRWSSAFSFAIISHGTHSHRRLLNPNWLIAP